MVQCRKVLIGIVAVGGTLATAAGLFLYFWMPTVIVSNIETKLALNNGSESYNAWEKTPLPIHFQIYLFNVTNPEEVLNGGKPIVQEVGPYGFLEAREKYDISFEDVNDTVKYLQRKEYYFSEALTNGSLEDMVTMPNVPLMAIVKQAQYQSQTKKFFFNAMMQIYKAKPFVTKTAGEMLFTGYFDSFVKFLSDMQKMTILPNNTFGFFYGQNGTADGLYEVFRGNLDIADLTLIATFNNETDLSYWNSTYCNMINGTDGSQFAPFVQRERQHMFISDFCRSLYLDYENDEIVKGIRLLRFSPPRSILEKPSTNPDNACFSYRDSLLWDRSGAMNVSICRKGAPIVVSLPHFYMADQIFLEQVGGLHPSELLHKTIVDIEPTTGVVMNAAKRLQMNLDFGSAKGIKGYEKLSNVILPLLWVYEGATIDDATADKFKSQVLNPLQLGKSITYLFIGIGSFLLLCLLVFFIARCLRTDSSQTRSPKISPNEDGVVQEKLLDSSGRSPASSNGSTYQP